MFIYFDPKYIFYAKLNNIRLLLGGRPLLKVQDTVCLGEEGSEKNWGEFSVFQNISCTHM